MSLCFSWYEYKCYGTICLKYIFKWCSSHIRLYIKVIYDAPDTAKHEAMYTDRIAVTVSNSVTPFIFSK
jgi:hypothetical protein